jgi:hypothetical protein
MEKGETLMKILSAKWIKTSFNETIQFSNERKRKTRRPLQLVNDSLSLSLSL